MDTDLVLDAHAEVGEGPIWDPDRNLLVWVDVTRGVVHQYLGSGRGVSIEIGQHVGAAAPRTRGGLVLAVQSGFALLDLDSGRLDMITDTEADRPGNRMNDGKCDSAGRFWAGTMSYTLERGAGSLYRLDAERRVSNVLSDLTLSNGLGWSPDDKTMYLIDSVTQGIDAFAYDGQTGAITKRRRVIDIAPELGMPDGMTVDTEGCIWVGLWGGWAVHRYTPDGRLDRAIKVPVGYVTSCAFGGSNLGDLYITTAAYQLDAEALARQPHAGGLFCCRPGPVGLPANAFRG
ncbi:MAG TPA: SMP-30/gluconolactonase/LRE family protein [Chloroflexota bacterium]